MGRVSNFVLPDFKALKNYMRALAGVAQWTKYQPENGKVSGSISVRAHAWVASQVPSWGHVRGN